jgi:hypothetical protein
MGNVRHGLNVTETLRVSIEKAVSRSVEHANRESSRESESAARTLPQTGSVPRRPSSFDVRGIEHSRYNAR